MGDHKWGHPPLCLTVKSPENSSLYYIQVNLSTQQGFPVVKALKRKRQHHQFGYSRLTWSPNQSPSGTGHNRGSFQKPFSSHTWYPMAGYSIQFDGESGGSFQSFRTSVSAVDNSCSHSHIGTLGQVSVWRVNAKYRVQQAVYGSTCAGLSYIPWGCARVTQVPATTWYTRVGK